MGAWRAGANLWYSGLVPYSINPDLANTTAIEDAIKELEDRTNLRFVRHYLEPDWIRYSKQTLGNANSKVGRVGGEQFVNASRSAVGTLIHESCHAVGIMHEHQRPDRDEYITFHPENAGGSEDNYELLDAEDMSVDYDIESIMHYHAGGASSPVFTSNTGVPHGGIGSQGVLTQTDEDFLNKIYPAAPVVRRSDGEGGAGQVLTTSAVAVRHPGNPNGAALLVNGIVNRSGDYQLLNWVVYPNGNVVRDGNEPDSATAGHASQVKVVAVGPHLVSAMKDGDDNVLLISHDVRLNRVSDSHGQAGEVRAVDIVALTNSLVLTPVVTGSGELLNILWEVGANGAIQRVGDSGDAGGHAESLSAALIDSNAGVHRIAVLCTEGPHLVLSTWRTNGTSVTKDDDSGRTMGTGTSARVVRSPAGPLVVACRDGDGNLLLMPFHVSSNGRIERITHCSVRAGEVSELDAVARPYGVLVAVTGGGGRLILIKWKVEASGVIERLGDSAGQAGQGNRVSVAALPYASLATAATVVQASDGTLLPIVWDDQDGPGEVDVV